MSNSFVHLHCHSEYSLLESACRVKDIVTYGKTHEQKSVALTDNGCMYGVIDFYQRAQAEGLNPIIGCDMYLVSDMKERKRGWDRLVLLAKDFTGYQTLIRLVSKSHEEGFYYKARIDYAALQEDHEGLIAISPGGRGPVADCIANNRDEEARLQAKTLKDIFGDDFYLGIQRLGLPFEDLIVDQSKQISEELGIPLVVTNDVYYTKKEDANLKDILACIQMGKRLEDAGRVTGESHEFYLKSPEEMAELFSDFPEALANTVKIAAKCDLNIEMDQVLLPNFECPDGLSSEDYLEKLLWEGIDERYPERTQEIKDRVAFELGIINKMHYANYFLIIFDFLDFCRREKIPVGPGRGSAAGSLVAYALDITKIDPLQYNLLFERFLNPERISMPDVDIDFCIRRRGEVIDYIVERYSQECVSQIITFGTMQARAVIRDVGRVLDTPLSEVDRIAKLIPAAPGQYTSIPDALEQVAELKKLYESSRDVQQLLDIGARLEGQSRHTSTHAAGVVISRDPLTTVVPLVFNDGVAATQFAMADIEKIGLLKMDILGLRNLTVLQDVVEMVEKYHGVTLDLDHLSVDDPKTYELMCRGEAIGVFQCESKGMRTLIKDLQPSVFEDIIALLALYRPGPLGSGMVKDFISNKSGETEIQYDLPELEGILKPTYGMIVYQEQVMQIASKIGGFSLGQADVLRRAMGKKKKSEMDRMQVLFLEGADERGFPVHKAKKIFELCYKFAEYGFNKSHSAAYALISYQTAYLKANYPVEYMCGLLSSVLSVSDKTSLYITESVAMGIPVLQPDVNDSLTDFSVTKAPNKEGEIVRAIRFGMGAIKNVGEGAIISIIENRESGPYEDLWDFCTRVDLKQVNKRVVESLIKSGAMDEFADRSKLLSHYEQCLEAAQVIVKERSNGQVGLFGADQASMGAPRIDENFEYVVISEQERLRMEKEILGLYITGHPLNSVKGKMEKMEYNSGNVTAEMNGRMITMAGLLCNTRRLITKTKKEMIIGDLEDLQGVVSAVAFQSDNFEELVGQFVDDNIVSIKGRVRCNQDEISLMVESIDVIDNANFQRRLFIDIDHLNDMSLLSEIQAVSKSFRGTMPLYIKVGDSTVLAHQKFWVKDDVACRAELEGLVGPGRLWVS